MLILSKLLWTLAHWSLKFFQNFVVSCSSEHEAVHSSYVGKVQAGPEYEVIQLILLRVIAVPCNCVISCRLQQSPTHKQLVAATVVNYIRSDI